MTTEFGICIIIGIVQAFQMLPKYWEIFRKRRFLMKLMAKLDAQITRT